MSPTTSPPTRPPQQQDRSKHTAERDHPSKKVYNDALESLMKFSYSDSDTGSNDDASPRALKAEVAENDGSDDLSVDSIAAHAARMFTSLKE